jgi:hypothetical protein
MKFTIKAVVASAALTLAATHAHAQTAITVGNSALLAGWDFNNISSGTVGSSNPRYSDVFGDTSASPFTSSAGAIYFNGTGGSDSWPSVTRVTTGADVDRAITGRSGGASVSGLGSLSGAEGMLSLASFASGTKDEFSILVHAYDGVNTFSNLNLSYYAKDGGTGGGTVSVAWFYSTDGGTTKTSAGISSNAVTGTSFTQYTADFSAITGLTGVADVYLIGVVSESISTANLQFDNLAVFGTSAVSAIPEPSTYAAIMGALALVGVTIARKRRALAAAKA